MKPSPEQIKNLPLKEKIFRPWDSTIGYPFSRRAFSAYFFTGGCALLLSVLTHPEMSADCNTKSPQARSTLQNQIVCPSENPLMRTISGLALLGLGTVSFVAGNSEDKMWRDTSQRIP